MNADTITIEAIADALAALEIATQAMSRLKRDAENGTLSPAEAYADFRDIMTNLPK